MPQTYQAARQPLKQGDFAPDFTLMTDGGKTFTLSKLKGQIVVLYFYPKDDTPGCTLEAKDFGCMNDEFSQLGATVVGISKDSVESHEKFKQKYDLPFILASDRDETVCEAYDCWVEKNMYGKKYMGIQRDTFLLNEDGRIVRVWRKVSVEGHAEQVLNEVKELNSR